MTADQARRRSRFWVGMAFVGVLLVVGAAIITLAPIVSCPYCDIMEMFSRVEPYPELVKDLGIKLPDWCPFCRKRGRITILRRYIAKPQDLDLYIGMRDRLEQAGFR